MSNKEQKEQKYDTPNMELSASSKKAKNKVITAAQTFNKNSWLQISQWLVIFKVFNVYFNLTKWSCKRIFTHFHLKL